MNFGITSVRYSIPFAFKDPKDIRNQVSSMIKERVLVSEKFKKKYGSARLAIIVVLKKETKELSVHGPTADKDLVDYAVWLPYRKIKQSENYRIEYLKFLIKGICIVFEKYMIGTNELFQIEKELVKSIIE